MMGGGMEGYVNEPGQFRQMLREQLANYVSSPVGISSTVHGFAHQLSPWCLSGVNVKISEVG